MKKMDSRCASEQGKAIGIFRKNETLIRKINAAIAHLTL